MTTLFSARSGASRRSAGHRAGWYDLPPDAESGLRAGDDTAGPAPDDFLAPGPPVPRPDMLHSSLSMVYRMSGTMFADARRVGEVASYHLLGRTMETVVISNPAHIRSLLVADPAIVPSGTRHSPLRPIIGPDSVLTSTGQRHRRQRALLMPRFHGKAVAGVTAAITAATTRHIDALSARQPLRVADLGQQITLDVIMGAVFGIADAAAATHAEARLRAQVIRALRLSIGPLGKGVQIANAGREDALWFTRLALRPLDVAVHAVIAERRRTGGGDDVLTMLLAARDEDGEALSDGEIRDELVTLLLAGHETTATTVAWTFERLTRHADVYARARDAARTGDDAYLEALLHETMRNRPVVPAFVRELTTAWRFGSYRVPAGSLALISTVLLHHRDDLYPRPFAFAPDRFVGAVIPPNTFTPFGGGNRRCLGAALAMAELRIVVAELLRRVEFETHDRPAERVEHRNVTMIPAAGGRAVLRRVE